MAPHPPALLVLCASLFACSGTKDDSKAPPDAPEEVDRPEHYRVAAPADAPSIGPIEAPVTIVTFSDFQAPRGARNARSLRDLRMRFADDLRVVYRANPQPRNPTSRIAELAARAARRQGLFWEVHDRLFEEKSLSRESILEAAREAGCDPARLERDMDDPDLPGPVARDRQEALELGVPSSPFNFVNGRPLAAIRFVDDAAVIVREELERARSLVPQTTRGKSPYEEIVATGTKRLPGAAKMSRKIRDPLARYRIPLREDEPFLGDASAPVTVVAFVDLRSPFFRRTVEALSALSEQMGHDVRIAARHFPQPTHPRAMEAAEACAEAAEQGKLWPFLREAAGGEELLEREDLVTAAVAAGMDPAKLEAALEAGTHEEFVAGHRELARSLALRGTPHFFINGRLSSGSRSADQLLVLASAELELAKDLESPDGGAPDPYEHFTTNGATEAVYLEPGAKEPESAVIGRRGHRVYNVPVPPDSPRLGDPDAPVTIVEFGDYQCGACARVSLLLDDIEKAERGRVSVVHRHFPLFGHEHARLAAEAAVEAGEQGMFWEYHRLLMKRRDALSLGDLVAHAKAAGLDAAKMREALSDRRHGPRVEADIADARALRLAGTPAIFVNGRKVRGTARADIERLVEELSDK